MGEQDEECVIVFVLFCFLILCYVIVVEMLVFNSFCKQVNVQGYSGLPQLTMFCLF